MSKITMYPTSVEQPNRDKSSGLQGKCFTPVKRNGETYDAANCKNQSDPKYHHEWSNAEEILNGNVIQCGRPSRSFCSHKTYYGIKGYRNTCPIAGVNGTYTQPATLKLGFDISKKGLSPTAKIKQVTLSFEHRCTGVDVGTGEETIIWGPNFSGGKKYSNQKALKIQFAGQEKILESNPPLSWNFSSTGNFIFKNVTYDDLANGYINVIYGNNLETNPGNIYIRNLKIDVEYEDATLYIEGYQSDDKLYIAHDETCRTPIHFKLYVGYKRGNTPIPPDEADKDPNLIKSNVLQSLVESDPEINLRPSSNPTEKNIVRATFFDESHTGGKKKITFKIRGYNKSVSFLYEALARNAPKITIPTKIERNTKSDNITSIVAIGCTSKITVYDGSINSDPIKTFTTFNEENIDKKGNIITEEDITDFYEVLSNLSCGWHTLFFKRGNESAETIPSRKIEILPNNHKFTFIDPETNAPITTYRAMQNKSSNQEVIVKYMGNSNLLSRPNFSIINSTHGKEVNGVPTHETIGDTPWNNVKISGAQKRIKIGTYYPGIYQIAVQDADVTCANKPAILTVIIEGKHKQHFDEIFVRGEDSTSFDYDYLVALEGDTVTQPVFVETIDLQDSYNDIKICASNDTKNIAGLTEQKTIDLQITNTTSPSKDIKNIFLELNTLIKDENGLYQVTSQEWLNPEGILYNFKENFEEYNPTYKDIVSIKNLTEDNDEIDEEDVYIHITELKKNKSINLKIPYSCNIEKEVYLQVLLFGEPAPIYKKDNCNEVMDFIPLKVYDSILTDLFIEGESDIFSTQIITSCPKECFDIKDIKYRIKNVDTSSLKINPITVIKNDPRLVPYKFSYKGKSYSLPENNSKLENVSFQTNITSYDVVMANGERVDAYIKFEGHEEIHLHQYTNYIGETTFFIDIPKTVGGKWTMGKLLRYMAIKFEGNISYAPAKKIGKLYTGDRNLSKTRKNVNSMEIVIPTNDMEYNAGQTIPIRVILKGHIKYLKNEIIFEPNIKKPGNEDELTVSYRACNLKNNEGILKTRFQTDDYKLVPNEIYKNIYCGVNTDIDLSTQLTKIIVEKKAINRLYLALNNKKRENKDVVVSIKELSPENYDVLNYEIDTGTIFVNKTENTETEETEVIWKIDYIKDDTVVRGHIDFKAQEIGLSEIKTKVTDFIDNMENKPTFGQESYKCDCRQSQEDIV